MYVLAYDYNFISKLLPTPLKRSYKNGQFDEKKVKSNFYCETERVLFR